jgi:hypothetical protein
MVMPRALSSQHFAGLAGLIRRHAGGGLVEQEELRLHAHRHADLQPLLLAMRELAGEPW